MAPMKRVFLYTGLLLAGMAAAQTSFGVEFQPILLTISRVCLAFIMIEVGLEFSGDITQLRPYARDFLVAAIAAIVPWILCTGYFIAFVGASWQTAGLV